MDNSLSGRRRPARQTSEKRRPVFPPAGRSVALVHSPDGMSHFLLSRHRDVIASFSFGVHLCGRIFISARIFVIYSGFKQLSS